MRIRVLLVLSENAGGNRVLQMRAAAKFCNFSFSDSPRLFVTGRVRASSLRERRRYPE